MRILLTGHKGFIGSALQHKLLNHGHTVIGIDNKDDDEQDLLFFDKWPDKIDLVFI